MSEVKTHHAVTHPSELIAGTRKETAKILALNDRVLDWLASHVLASMAMFDIALVVPLLVLPLPDSIKITLGVISGSWIQWWALPALQRSSNKVAAQNDAKADADHRTLTYLATIQDEQLEILKRLDPPAPALSAKVAKK